MSNKKKKVNIGIDLLGSDNSPETELEAVFNFAKHNKQVFTTIFGPNQYAEKVNNFNNIQHVSSSKGVPMDVSPSFALKNYKNSTLDRGTKALRKNTIDAFVSAGNTGAVLAFSIRNTKRIKGIPRPAILITIPTPSGPKILIDGGANSDCKPEYLVGFAKISLVFAKHVIGLREPLVGLLNIGTEENKGDRLRKEAFKEMQKLGPSFYGNIEPHEIFKTPVQIFVTDGFTGNIILKLLEGTFDYLKTFLKKTFSKASPIQKFGASLVKGLLNEELKAFSYQEYGGAVLLGLEKPVIISHGRSDQKTLENALNYALSIVKANLPSYFDYTSDINSENKDNNRKETLF